MNSVQNMRETNAIATFFQDIKPFFYNRMVFYVDIGANRGDTFSAIMNAGLSVNRAMLVEANPKIFVELERTVAKHGLDEKITCLNLAISDTPGKVRLRDMQDMSAVVQMPAFDEGSESETALEDRFFDVHARRFDDLAEFFPDRHVSIMKVDVEGHEAAVLRGCKKMLDANAIDVLYVEAGVSPDNPELTYFREIDDILTSYGYRLFRIYEQTHEWIEDLPILRRFNVAYLSPAMINRYPMSKTSALSKLQADLAGKNEALKSRFEEIATLTRMLEANNGAQVEVDNLRKSLQIQQETEANNRAQVEVENLRKSLRIQQETVAKLTARMKGKTRKFNRWVGGLLIVVFTLVATVMYLA